MSWHRMIRIPAEKNFFFHFSVESYDNMGIISTLAKENGTLILECSTPMSNAKFFDPLIDKLLKEVSDD